MRAVFLAAMKLIENHIQGETDQSFYDIDGSQKLQARVNEGHLCL